jgi:hypothetical protein
LISATAKVDAASRNSDKTEQQAVGAMTSPERHSATNNDEPSTKQRDDAANTDSDAADDVTKRAMGMLRLGRAGSRQPSDRRAMSALRLGRRNGWTSATGESTVDATEFEKDKRKSMSMLRLGRAGQVDQPTSEFKEEEEKRRAMSALRLGRKRSSIDDAFAESQLGGDVISEDVSDESKRAMGMLRLGRNLDDESDLENVDLTSTNDNEKRAMGMLRLGRQSLVAPSRIDRRKSMAMLRLG